MIELSDLLTPSRIACHCELKSKKKALQTLSELIGPDLPDEDLSEMGVLDAFINREKLGSTGLGHGVALPHGRLEGLSSPLAALITLNNGVDFESPDNEGVDLVFGLVVPEQCNEEHLSILAELAKRFSDAGFRQALRDSPDPDSLYALLKDEQPGQTAQASGSA